MHTAAFALLLVTSLPLQAQSIDEFFDEFTAEWVRGDPNLATYLRYFEGEEQDRMDRQLTPPGRAYALERIALAKGGLEQLREFDRSQLTDINRVSADLLDWQLLAMVDREPFLDFDFPLNQFRGANVGLPRYLMRIHPVASERDAENYVAKLAQIGARMDTAIAEVQRREAKGVVPPRFILDATT